MAGHGTGYPLSFACPIAKRNRVGIWGNGRGEIPALPSGHNVLLTGRTKMTTRNGKGHGRKLWTSFEYSCRCGHVGWSSHPDMLGIPLQLNATMGQQYDERRWHGQGRS